MMMGSSSCLPAREAFPKSSSLLCFLSSRSTDECTGNGGQGSLFEHSATTGRLGLGLLGLEGEVLGLSALLARDRVEDLFLGLEQRRIRAKTACGTFDCFDFGDGRNYLVDGSCSRRRMQEKPCRTSRNLLAGTRTRSCTASERISSEGLLAEPVLHRRRSRRGEIPLPRSIRTLVVVLAAEQVPARSRARRWAALASEC
jgi:hypothetical protein